MAFKLGKSAAVSLESPESLFRDIKTKKVHGPLADQADLWRVYQEKALGLPDVALQLPTGAGKTLVGLVLAEWRRLKNGERVVYLCPTRQLVNQVVDQSIAQYGIKVHGFTGSKKAYDPGAAAEYRNCERVAVTTYSSLFNSAPFFDDPHIILLDDAHAAEQYIAGMWTLEVHLRQENHRALYETLVATLKPAISVADGQRLLDPEEAFRDRFWVEKIPTPTLLALQHALIRAVDALVGQETYPEPNHKFAWRAIRDHLECCHMYLGAGSILIRPLLPPTSTHHPFSDARQRLYMSATFGGGGELERITGRPDIARLQAKASWDRQAIGRRYFLFPERSLGADQEDDLCVELMKRAGRTLVLTPDGRRAGTFTEFVGNRLAYPVFDAQAIEKSKAAFVGKQRAVAIVANRYEGIDFPEGECRLLMIEGLPRATNLQEQFLIGRMGAVDLLNGRITTRLVQAFGRCTRSDQDFSAVVIRGEELNKHLMTPERRAYLHPELHAELQFGIEQAQGATVKDYQDNFDAFLAQGEAWREANADILGKRDRIKQDQPPGTQELADAAPIEIEYVDSLWNKDYESAFDKARAVLGLLKEPKLRGYRAMWHYLAGSAAWLAFEAGASGFDTRAREQFRAALKAEKTLAWLVPLSKLAYVDEVDQEVIEDKDTWSVVERLETLFDRVGTLTDHKYNKIEAEIRAKLDQNNASIFEDGHAQLGRLLGYEAGNRNDAASPDPWWMANGSLCFIFEDHSDSKPDGSLSVDKARQVCTHPNWVKEHLPVDAGARIVPVLVTPVRVADKAALPHLAEVLVWNLEDFRSWMNNALGVLREIRKDYPNAGDLAWRAMAAERLGAAAMTPRALLEMLETRVGATVLKRTGDS
jgi:hypothetical protein